MTHSLVLPLPYELANIVFNHATMSDMTNHKRLFHSVLLSILRDVQTWYSEWQDRMYNHQFIAPDNARLFNKKGAFPYGDPLWQYRSVLGLMDPIPSIDSEVRNRTLDLVDEE
jgi:hypothetical protein